MPRRDTEPLTPEAERELEAIDAVLRGEPVGSEWAQTAELALLLRDERPRPRGEFATNLDERVAAGFTRRRSAKASRSKPRRARSLVPALAVAACVLVAIVGIGAALSGGPDRKVDGAYSTSPGGLSSPPGAPLPNSDAPRQVERTSSLTLGVAPERLQDVSSQVFDITARVFHGYVESSSVSSGDAATGGGTFALRIPSDQVAAAEARLTRLGRVQAQTDTTQDITSAVVSATHQLADAQAERGALLRALGKATTTNQTDAIRARLHIAEGRIASAQRDLRAVHSRADFTRVALTLVPATRAAPPRGGFGPGAALHAATRILAVALSIAIVVLAVIAPVALLVCLAWLAVRAVRRRRREQALEAT